MRPSLWPGALDSIGNILAHLPMWVFLGRGRVTSYMCGAEREGLCGTGLLPACTSRARGLGLGAASADGRALRFSAEGAPRTPNPAPHPSSSSRAPPALGISHRLL